VKEVPNNFNTNWFFDNLNFEQRQKVFAFKVPRFGEIWWCFPKGNATECTHAVIFNVREGYWYDTELPVEGRCSGFFSNHMKSPLLFDPTLSDTGYKVWRHEQGTDKIDGTNVEAIKSYFETSDISIAAEGTNKKTRITAIEPDFVQDGDMSVYVTGRANARAPEVVSTVVTYPEDATTDPSKQVVVLKEQRRELRVRFESNSLGGDYQTGQVLLHVEPGDGTFTG